MPDVSIRAATVPTYARGIWCARLGARSHVHVAKASMLLFAEIRRSARFPPPAAWFSPSIVPFFFGSGAETAGLCRLWIMEDLSFRCRLSLDAGVKGGAGREVGALQRGAETVALPQSLPLKLTFSGICWIWGG